MKSDTLVMLDLDGTIIDSSRLYFQGVPLIVKRHLGLHISRQDILPMWGQLALNFFTHFAAQAGHADPILINKMYLDFSAYYNAHHNRLATLYAEVGNCLGTIRAAVHSLGVVTTRPSTRSAPVLEMSWVRHIDFFVWGDQVHRGKPFPDGLEAAIAAHATDDGPCVYAGDNPNDMKAAQACERPVISVAALWGAMNKDALMASDPDYAFDSFSDFARWVTFI